MAYSIIVHVQNSDPVLGEVDELPSKSDTMVMLKSPRRVDGKDLAYLAESAVIVYWPVERVNFIEVISSHDEEELIGFVRE